MSLDPCFPWSNLSLDKAWITERRKIYSLRLKSGLMVTGVLREAKNSSSNVENDGDHILHLDNI